MGLHLGIGILGILWNPGYLRLLGLLRLPLAISNLWKSSIYGATETTGATESSSATEATSSDEHFWKSWISGAPGTTAATGAIGATPGDGTNRLGTYSLWKLPESKKQETFRGTHQGSRRNSCNFIELDKFAILSCEFHETLRVLLSGNFQMWFGPRRPNISAHSRQRALTRAYSRPRALTRAHARCTRADARSRALTGAHARTDAAFTL